MAKGNCCKNHMQYLVFVRCCRVWPIIAGHPLHHCGLCNADEFAPATEEEWLEEQGKLKRTK